MKKIKKNTAALLFILTWWVPLQSQGWQLELEEGFQDIGFAITETRDGQLVLAGILNDQLTLVKLNRAGELLWQRALHPATDCTGATLEESRDGGLLVTAQVVYPQSDSVFIFYTEASGEPIWSNRISSTGLAVVKDTEQLSNGGWVLVGSVASPAAARQIALWKLDAEGQFVWQSFYGGAGSDEACAVFEKENGELSVVARQDTQLTNGNILQLMIMETDKDGVVQATHTYGRDLFFYLPNRAVRLEDGSIVIGGELRHFITQPAPRLEKDFFLAKVSSDGNFLWAKHYAGALNEKALALASTPDGGFTLSGDALPYQTGWASPQVFMLKTDGEGREICREIINPESVHQSARDMVVTEEGQTVFAGLTANTPASPSMNTSWLVQSLDDFCGTATPAYSLAEAHSIRVYPNPAHHWVTIELAEPVTGMTNIRLYNSQGAIVREFQIKNNPARLSLQGLPSGLYFPAISMANGNTVVKMLALE